MADDLLCKIRAIEIDATLAKTFNADGWLTVLLNLAAWAFQAVPADDRQQALDRWVETLRRDAWLARFTPAVACDRPADEMDVTSAMVEAGVEAFFPNQVLPYEVREEVLTRVYRAMKARAKDRSKCPRLLTGS